MQYKIEIGYRKFIFDNSIDAMTFATMVKEHNISSDYVEITLIDDDDLEEEAES